MDNRGHWQLALAVVVASASAAAAAKGCFMADRFVGAEKSSSEQLLQLFTQPPHGVAVCCMAPRADVPELPVCEI
jgi:hypothetical protein